MAQPNIAKNLIAICPACGAKVPFKVQPKVEQVLDCPSCDAALAVIAVDPIELEWMFYEDEYEEEGDYDYEDDDYDYEDDEEYEDDDYEDDDYDYEDD